MAAITWGIIYGLEQKVLEKLDVFTVILIQSMLFAIVLIPLIKFGNDIKTIFVDRTLLGIFLLLTGLTLLADFFILSAVKYAGAAKASVFEITYPIFVTLFVIIAFGE